MMWEVGLSRVGRGGLESLWDCSGMAGSLFSDKAMSSTSSASNRLIHNIILHYMNQDFHPHCPNLYPYS